MTKKLGPKGNPMGRKAGSGDNPSNRIVSGIMADFLSLVLGIKRESIQAYFSRNRKSLHSLEDCRDYIFVKLHSVRAHPTRTDEEKVKICREQLSMTYRDIEDHLDIPYFEVQEILNKLEKEKGINQKS